MKQNRTLIQLNKEKNPGEVVVGLTITVEPVG